jgi:hypothetical protein
MSKRIASATQVLLLVSCGASWAADPPVSSTSAAASAKATTAASKPADATKTATSKTSDQLVLDPTLVSGNRELPKVMYIVPWKKADLSDLPGQPFNTLLDEALTPVDREVFQRQVKYYEVVAGKDQASPAASGQAGQQATPSADRK